MGDLGLDGIIVTPLKRIATPGGDVMHAMKNADSGYNGFGEAYFSWVDGGAVKAWKKHRLMTLNLVVPIGSVRFVMTMRPGNGDDFRVFEIGNDNYARLTVPPGIWFGFQGLGAPRSLVLNIADIQHDPIEVERLGVAEINFDWS